MGSQREGHFDPAVLAVCDLTGSDLLEAGGLIERDEVALRQQEDAFHGRGESNFFEVIEQHLRAQALASEREAHDDRVDAEHVALIVVAHHVLRDVARVIRRAGGYHEGQQRVGGVVRREGGVAEVRGVGDAVVEDLAAGGLVARVAGVLEVGDGGQVDDFHLL